jgi:hypothetical protein
MNTNKRETEHTANLAMAYAPVFSNTPTLQNGWKVGKNFFAKPSKRDIITSVKTKR